jgi:hypothetical protein
MPGGDGTGPNGLGSRTGRALGYCAGYDTPGYTKGPGRGIGRRIGGDPNIRYGRGQAWGRRGGWWYGRGGYIGRGRGGIFYPAPVYPAPIELTPEQKITSLKQDREYLETELKSLQSSIEDVSKKILELEQDK